MARALLMYQKNRLMATIVFFEKTGCINNTKQKQILTLAGHQVEAIDLLEYPWTKEKLLAFFEGLPVKDWFNINAPSVQSGKVKPDNYSFNEALEAMLLEPLLIRRPLIMIGDHKIVGFDKEKIREVAGLRQNDNPEMIYLLNQNLVDCPQKSKGNSCD